MNTTKYEKYPNRNVKLVERNKDRERERLSVVVQACFLLGLDLDDTFIEVLMVHLKTHQTTTENPSMF